MGDDTKKAGLPMYYSEFAPASRLSAHVASYWHFRVSGASGDIPHTVPPTGGAFLSFLLEPAAAVFVGPHLAPLQLVVRAGSVYWGVHFWPGAASSLPAGDMEQFRNRRVPANDVIDQAWVTRTLDALRVAATVEQARAALDAALAPLIAAARPLDREVMMTVALIVGSQGSASIESIAHAVGISPRHLRRRFRQKVGISPKELARIRRVLAAAAEAAQTDPVSWSTLAANRGYFDQPHLVYEFKKLMGQSPTQLLQHLRRIKHGQMRGKCGVALEQLVDEKNPERSIVQEQNPD